MTPHSATPAALDRATVLWVNGDHEGALTVAFNLDRGNLCRIARHVVGQDSAADVVQEVFLRVWRNPSSFDPTRSTLAVYLRIVTRGMSIDHVRSRSARERRDAGANARADLKSPDPADTVDEYGTLTRLADAVRMLPLEQRTPLVAAYYGDRSYCAVAQRLGVPEGTIKHRIRRALRQLRHDMSDDDT